MPARVVAFNVPQTEHEIVRVQADTVPYFYDKLHQHPEIQIMLIEAGQGTLVASDYVGRFQPGDLYVIGSRQPHVFRCDPPYYKKGAQKKAKSLSLYFSDKYFGNELWNSNELSSVRQFATESQQCYKITSAEAVEIVRQLSRTKGIEKMVGFFSLLKLLLETPDKKKLAIQPGQLQLNEESRMNSILEFTFRESHRKIYLKEIAQRANLSEEAFCRYFKLHTRKTYINFLNEVRVSNACQLLIQRDTTIQQVCYNTGFNNVSNFNRIFKKVTGKTPQSFRYQLPFGK